MLNYQEQNLRNVLIRTAKRNTLITYSDACKEAALPLDMANPDHRNQLAAMLARVSVFETDHHRPMLSALVVHQNGMDPGNGFYTFAERLGLLREGSKSEERMSFFANQVKEIHRIWSKRTV